MYQNSEDWKLVVDYMHYNGKYKDVLNNSQFISVYILADGYGDLGISILDLVGYDWSHIRDSSDFAIKRMANKIRQIVRKNKIEKELKLK